MGERTAFIGDKITPILDAPGIGGKRSTLFLIRLCSAFALSLLCLCSVSDPFRICVFHKCKREKESEGRIRKHVLNLMEFRNKTAIFFDYFGYH